MCVNVCPLVCLSVAYGLSSLCTLLQSPRNRPPGLTASLDALKPEMPKIDEVSEPEKSTTSTITISTSPTTPTPPAPSSALEAETPSNVASTTADGTESVDSSQEVSSALSVLNLIRILLKNLPEFRDTVCVGFESCVRRMSTNCRRG